MDDVISSQNANGLKFRQDVDALIEFVLLTQVHLKSWPASLPVH